MAVYVLVIFMESLWISSSVTLMATNNHSKLGVIYVLSATISIGIANILASHLENCSLALITTTLILMHALVASYTIKAGFKLTQDTIWNWK